MLFFNRLLAAQSDPFSVVLGGAYLDPNVPPATPANLTSLKAF